MSCEELALVNAPLFLSVTGRKGKNTVINGSYNRGEYTHCGRVYYEKCSAEDVTDQCVIRWHPGGIWMFCPRLAYDLKGFACVKDQGQNPCEVTKIWRVFNETGFETEPNLTIKVEEDKANYLKDLLESSVGEDSKEHEIADKTRIVDINNVSSQIFE